jgi:orotate phosphoribosyltransferase
VSAEEPGGEREALARLLAERSFRTGRFQLSSGRESSYYVDCRTTTMHARGQALLGRVALDRLEAVGWAPDFVGGLTMGADPISYAVAGESARRGGAEIHAFSVRKEAKEHGRGRRIEGCFDAGGRVVVTEDVITTGGSALDACRAVEEAGGEILGLLVLVDRQEGGGEALREAGYPVEALFTISDLEQASG